MRKALGIDIGTSKICAVLFDIDSFQVLTTYSVPNDATLPADNSVYYEQDANGIWESVVLLFDQIKQDVPQFEFISITGQMHGILLLDGGQNPISPLITWRDARDPHCTMINEYGFENGCSLHLGYGGSSLLALKQEGFFSPCQKPCKITSITSYIMGKLCGDFRVDQTIAASFGLYNIHDSIWNFPQILALGLDQKLFDEVVSSSVSVARVRPEIAKAFGISDSVTVFSPIGDNQASVIGSTGFSQAGVINLGTGGQLSFPSTLSEHLSSVEIRPLPGVGYLKVYSSLCGGWTYAYLKDFCKNFLLAFDIKYSDQKIYAVLDNMIETHVKSEGLTVDTRFLGTRENPDLRGSIENIDTVNFTLANLAVAFARGIIEELHRTEICKDGMEFIVASGNAVRKSPFMRRIIEDVFGCKCMTPPFVEEACVGSIVSCLATLEGKERIRSIYRNYFDKQDK